MEGIATPTSEPITSNESGLDQLESVVRSMKRLLLSRRRERRKGLLCSDAS